MKTNLNFEGALVGKVSIAIIELSDYLMSRYALFFIFTISFILSLGTELQQEFNHIILGYVDNFGGIDTINAVLKALSYTIIYYVIYYVITSFINARYGLSRPAISYSSPGGIRKDADKLEPLSAERIKRVALHEAGHLLALALFEEKPEKLTAFVSGHRDFTLGRVEYKFGYDKWCSKKACLANMKVKLAGHIAEEMLHGDPMIGSKVDFDNWERLAKDYLSTFTHNYEWFQVPDNGAEARLNLKTLSQIKADHTAEVEKFLSLNADLLEEATSILSENRDMHGESLTDIVMRAKLGSVANS